MLTAAARSINESSSAREINNVGVACLGHGHGSEFAKLFQPNFQKQQFAKI